MKIEFYYGDRKYTLEETSDSSQATLIAGKQYILSPSTGTMPPSVQDFMEVLRYRQFDSPETFQATVSAMGTQEKTIGSLYQDAIHPNLTTQNMSKKIDQILTAAVEKEDFRGTVLVKKKGQVILGNGYGIANAEGKPITPDTIFHLGSLSKQFTAVAILVLEQEGKLHTSDPIQRHIPKHLYNPAWNGVTVQHLLNHSSGISDFDQEYYAITDPMTPEQIIMKYKDKPLDFIPGTAWDYTNYGYELLGVIIEQASGQSYGDFVKEALLDKCDMQDSGYGGSYAMEKAATGYQKDPQGSLVAVEDQKKYLANAYAGGGLYSTANDMGKWDRALYGKLLNKNSLEKAFHSTALPAYIPPGENVQEPPTMHYGYGFHLFEDPNLGMRAYHFGGIEGFQCVISRYLKTEDCIVILSNNASINLTELLVSVDKVLTESN